MTSLTINIAEEERLALQRIAGRNLREIENQARFILRETLIRLGEITDPYPQPAEETQAHAHN